VTEIWIWGRPGGGWNQIGNVTVSVGATFPGTDVTCITGLTATIDGSISGPLKVACSGAQGQIVQYVYLQQFRASSVSDHLSVNEIIVWRDGGAWAWTWAWAWQGHENISCDCRRDDAQT
jgi:hypothetical protein